jgi:transposase-like protein
MISRNNHLLGIETMILCKHCGNEKIVKDGMVKNRQRYLCKGCDKTFRLGDNREKYPLEKRIKVVKLYIEGMGLRSIERVEGVPSSLLVHWIRGFSRMIREKICTTQVPDDAKEIAILEMDELFTYYQKKLKEPMCGLLWTETGIKLLISL